MTLAQALAHLDDSESLSLPDPCEDCHNNGGWFDRGVWVDCSCVREKAERDELALRDAVKAHNRRHGRDETWDGVL